MPKTSEHDLQEALRCLVEDEELQSQIGEDKQVVMVRSFAEQGLLTNNHGLVLYLSDGTKFELTIIKDNA